MMLFILIFQINPTLYAQKEYNVWQTAGKLRLDFNFSPPVLTSEGVLPILGEEGSAGGRGTAVICDHDGKLLMYTDGKQVFNSGHTLVEDGDLLLLDDDIVSEPILIYRPGFDNHILLFYSKWEPELKKLFFAEYLYENNIINLIYKDSLLMESQDYFIINAAKLQCDSSILIITKRLVDS